MARCGSGEAAFAPATLARRTSQCDPPNPQFKVESTSMDPPASTFLLLTDLCSTAAMIFHMHHIPNTPRR